MTFQQESDLFEFIKVHEKTCTWIKKARENHSELNALVTGHEFHKHLIHKIEKIESEDRALARKRYSKDIRDMFGRVMQPRLSVFSAYGGSVNDNLENGQIKEKIISSLKEFKGQKSIKKYLSENFFRLEDIDPNGLLFLEYKGDEDIYPTYKSINDIRYYESNGQLLNVLIFEPKTVHKDGQTLIKWRVVDDEKDYCVYQDGDKFVIDEEKTFTHPFGSIPAIILSDQQEIGSELRISPIFEVQELASDYARDKSIKTIYKFQHGFPRHWRYVKECRPCHGTGKTGDGSCGHCNGLGHIQRNDVTDIQTLALPREDDQVITPNVEGFISPDLATWERYNEDLKDMEDLIESTMWGTRRIDSSENETATGRFIDVQPVINKLGWFTDNVEWVHNKLIQWVESWAYGSPQSEQRFTVIYGRRFIIESPDAILDKYNISREKGDNNTILDKLLDEFIMAKYQNDTVLLAQMQKKRLVEPYVHLSIEQVNTIFGSVEAEKKVLFSDFWEIADYSKTVEQLKNDFKEFVNNNSINQKSINISNELIKEYTNIDAEVTGDERPDIESESKAKLKGSVGGVQGILEIQKSVSEGITQYEAALTLLNEIYGFDEVVGSKLLGNKNKINSNIINNQSNE